MTLAACGSDKKALAWTAFLFQKEIFDRICYSHIDDICLVAAPLCGI